MPPYRTPARPSTLALALAAAGLATTAAAQTPAPAPGAPQTVIVTAQKRPQRLQDVPVAVTVVTGQDIENRGIASFAELLTQIPNTSIDQNTAAQPTITIRGITSSTNNLGIESGVGVVVDDVFLGRPGAFSTQLIDIERVEVLRGSQGTLFGKNTTGGLVNIVTSRPSRRLDGAADLTLGNHGLRQLRGFVTGPVGDSAAAKISFTSRRRDGWVENRTPGEDALMSEHFDGVRGQFQGKAGGVSWLVSADHGRDRAIDNYYDVREGALAAFDDNGADRSVATNGENRFRRTVKGASLRLEGEWAGAQWVSITARRSLDWFGSNDQDYTALPVLVLSRQEAQSQFTQELRVSGKTGALTWLGGLYHFRQSQDGTDRMLLQEATPPLFGLPDIPGYRETADTVVGIETRSTAGFGSLTFALSGTVDLNAGARYTRERKTLDYRQHLDQMVGLIGALASEVDPTKAARSESAWSGDLGLAFRHDRDLSSYLKLSQGFKGGGFNTTQSPTSTPGDLAFNAEKVAALEGGVKSVLAGGRLRLNAALFHTDYRDKQEQFFDGVMQRVSNAARAKVSGAELELGAQPAAGWQFTLAAGLQNPRYTDYAGYEGKRLVDASRRTASAGLQHERGAWAGWMLMARADISYRSKSYQQPDNDERYTQPGHSLVNAALGLRSEDGRYGLMLWAKNLGNKTYRASTYSVDAFQTQYQSVNAPRMVGVELRVGL